MIQETCAQLREALLAEKNDENVTGNQSIKEKVEKRESFIQSSFVGQREMNTSNLTSTVPAAGPVSSTQLMKFPVSPKSMKNDSLKSIPNSTKVNDTWKTLQSRLKSNEKVIVKLEIQNL